MSRQSVKEVSKVSYISLRKQMLGLALVILLLIGCDPVTLPSEVSTPSFTSISPTDTPEPTPAPTHSPEPTPTSAPVATPSPEVSGMWVDVTEATIGQTGEWTNKVELADINGDGLVDLLFANGGDYETAGEPELSRVFLNTGSGEMFEEATQQVFGPDGMLARVIKVRDLNGDAHPDIIVGTTFQTQSQLYLGEGAGNFTNVTSTHLPQIEASVGDLEFGDVDNDGDLDVVLADWGSGSPMENDGGRTMLWLNDGTAHFSDATDTHMPDVLVKFSWELELVDIDNDYDLDILVSCKTCEGSKLFENDGAGQFDDITQTSLPQFSNNYDFEAMDMNGDGYLDLVTINDGNPREHIFINNGGNGFEDATEQLWPRSENIPHDDNMAAFLDYDSDGDADFLIGSLNGPDRLLVNDGSGQLTMDRDVFVGADTVKTLGIAVADLNGDGKLDVVQGQGESESPYLIDEKVYFGKDVQPDTAPPVITLVEETGSAEAEQSAQVRARIHDNKSPTMPHDWQSVMLRWTENGQTEEKPMQWYGEYLWRGMIEGANSDFSYQVCATDAAGNDACSSMIEVSGD